MHPVFCNTSGPLIRKIQNDKSQYVIVPLSGSLKGTSLVRESIYFCFSPEVISRVKDAACISDSQCSKFSGVAILYQELLACTQCMVNLRGVGQWQSMAALSRYLLCYTTVLILSKKLEEVTFLNQFADFILHFIAAQQLRSW